MLVYRSDAVTTDTVPAFDRLTRRVEQLSGPSHDAVTSLLIDLGELESAVADRLFPVRDGIQPLAERFRRATVQAGHALIASWRGRSDRRDCALARLLSLLHAIPVAQLPPTVSTRVSEGYAYYAVHPESYAVAAERFAAAEAPSRVVCIGIRSIGTSLSAVVAAALEQRGIPVSLLTVRPRGHPFERRLDLDESLSSRLLESSDAHFLIVDEGPGLSGSSFASVARALDTLGGLPDRVALFPSWNPDGAAFKSGLAQSIWRQHRRYCVSASDAARGIESVAPGGLDVSAGKWRRRWCKSEASWPAVHPQHESVKRWIPGDHAIVRFAGLGQYGELKRQRADALACADLGPAPNQLRGGYLSLPFLEAVGPVDADEMLIDAAARHCAFVAQTFPASRAPSVDDLFAMVVANIREGLGTDSAIPDLERFRTVLDSAPGAAIDGRMFPHEWIRTQSGLVKIDALDHHCDHFFPGAQDAGWDLAATAFEFNLDRSGRDRLVERYRHRSRDRDIAARMPFYEIAYPAFRMGYATLAADSLATTPDGIRFRHVADRCRNRLRAVIQAPSAP